MDSFKITKNQEEGTAMSNFMKPDMYASYNSDTDTDTDSDLDVGEDNRKELTKPVQFGLPPDTLTYVP